MNSFTASGHLRADAADGYTPATAGRPAMRKVSFDLWLGDGDQAFPVRCVITSETVIAKALPRLVAGAIVIIAGRMVGRPFEKQDVQRGWSREIAVAEVEIPRGVQAA